MLSDSRFPLGPNVEAEFAKEVLRDGEIRNDEIEMIEGVNTQFARPTGRTDKSLDRGHRISLQMSGRRLSPERHP